MYRSILVPVDLDHPGSWAKSLPTAVELRRTFGARLTVMTVVPDWRWLLEAQTSPITFEDYLEAAKLGLGTIVTGPLEAAEVDIHIEVGSVSHGIIAAARSRSADLIVMSSHRPELSDYLIGATASRVVRHADCSIFVVRD